MCWNKEVSIKTWLFSIFTICYALYTKTADIRYLVFYLVFSSIQLVEYFLWTNINNPVGNAFWSKVGLFVIILEPLASMIVIKDTSFRNKMMMVYSLSILILFTIIKPLNTINFSSTKAPNGHLKWNWLQFPFYVFVLFILFLLFPYFYIKDYLTFGVQSVLVSMIIYTYYKSGTWGSLWCWISNFAGLLWIFKSILK